MEYGIAPRRGAQITVGRGAQPCAAEPFAADISPKCSRSDRFQSACLQRTVYLSVFVEVGVPCTFQRLFFRIFAEGRPFAAIAQMECHLRRRDNGVYRFGFSDAVSGRDLHFVCFCCRHTAAHHRARIFDCRVVAPASADFTIAALCRYAVSSAHRSADMKSTLHAYISSLILYRALRIASLHAELCDRRRVVVIYIDAVSRNADAAPSGIGHFHARRKCTCTVHSHNAAASRHRISRKGKPAALDGCAVCTAGRHRVGQLAVALYAHIPSVDHAVVVDQSDSQRSGGLYACRHIQGEAVFLAPYPCTPAVGVNAQYTG